MKILILILSIIMLSFNVFANGFLCTKAQEIEADRSISKAHRWEDIYDSFRKFQHCDDGYIAEGYSNLIVKTLSHRWEQINVLVKIVSKDKDFYDFVIRHIDATTDKTELEMIISNSNKCSSKITVAICAEIKNAANKALKEIGE
jgi:hypothetical protein